MLYAILLWQVLTTIALVWAIMELRVVSSRLRTLRGPKEDGTDHPQSFSPIGRSVPDFDPLNQKADLPPKKAVRKSWDASENERAEYERGLLLPDGSFDPEPLYRE